MADSVPAVLCQLAQHGVAVQWRDGKAVFSAKAAPPGEIVALIDARKANISAFLHPEAIQDRLDAASDLLRSIADARPPDVFGPEWRVAMKGLEAFIAAGHAAEAERLGWPPNELYGVPPVWARVELCGAGLLVGDRQVIAVTATEIRIKTASGSSLGIYRKPAVDYALVFRERLKRIGGDACLEEPRLRALEHTVNVFRANHPDADIDAAKTAVLAALKGEER